MATKWERVRDKREAGKELTKDDIAFREHVKNKYGTIGNVDEEKYKLLVAAKRKGYTLNEDANGFMTAFIQTKGQENLFEQEGFRRTAKGHRIHKKIS